MNRKCRNVKFYLVLNHRWSLSTQHLDCLIHVDNSLVSHSLQDDAESDEDTGSANTSTVGTDTQYSLFTNKQVLN